MNKIYGKYPITCSICIDNFFIIGGGGGATKSGIKNGISIFYIENFKFVEVFDEFYATDSPTNLLKIDNLLIVICDYALYIYTFNIFSSNFAIKLNFHRKFSDLEGYINTALISPDSAHLFLGDSCGGIHKFDFNNLNTDFFKISKSNITSISFHPYLFQIVVSTAKDNSFVRKSNDLSVEYSLNINFDDQNYFIRNSIFNEINGKIFLFTTHCMVKSRKFCYVVKWSTDFYFPLICIRCNYHFIPIKFYFDYFVCGTSSGKLCVFSSFDLKKCWETKEIHSAGISSISFIKNIDNVMSLTTSPDGSICLDSLKFKRKSSNYFWFMISILFLSFILAKCL